MTNKTDARTRYQFGQGASHAVPKAALRFDSADVQIQDAADGAKTAPVKLVARTGQPIEHWYWGKVVHDMAGMKLTKPRIPIDYCHEDDEVIGYGDKFDTSSGDLVITGAIVPYSTDPDDKGTEVLYKSKAGIPYEASINFCGDGILVEEVPDGFVTQVNGYQFEGPGLIIRQWPLRGVAICPYGADSNTEAEFKESSDRITVTLFSKETGMKTEQTPAAPPAATPPPAGQLAQKPGESTASTTGEPKPGAEFVAAFGAQGAVWFLEGRKFADCVAEFNAALTKSHTDTVAALKTGHEAEVTALKANIAALQTKLANAPRGNEAAGFSVEKKPAAAPGSKQAKLSNLSENTRKFAEGIRLPGQSKEKEEAAAAS